ncbi:uncharacterized protein BJX67DRAFT_141882 [Aspergillus lucknowensis]|uniref:Uncharacterized protein n=1 Tax=Aspergillus lucknowensis TaxID=176173 RepID=A0ABR4LNV8_9EURO
MAPYCLSVRWRATVGTKAACGVQATETSAAVSLCGYGLGVPRSLRNTVSQRIRAERSDNLDRTVSLECLGAQATTAEPSRMSRLAWAWTISWRFCRLSRGEHDGSYSPCSRQTRRRNWKRKANAALRPDGHEMRSRQINPPLSSFCQRHQHIDPCDLLITRRHFLRNETIGRVLPVMRQRPESNPTLILFGAWLFRREAK